MTVRGRGASGTRTISIRKAGIRFRAFAETGPLHARLSGPHGWEA